MSAAFCRKALIVFAFTLCSFVTLASAESKKAAGKEKEKGPDATVQEIVGRMKKEGNPSVVVEYVNWDKAFAEFPEKQREQLSVKNPQELRTFFFEMLAHPTQTMKKQMETRLTNIPADKQEEAKQSIAKIEDMMRAKEAEMKERLSATNYEIGEVKVEGNRAVVKLVQVYQDQKRVEDVPLEKEGGRWLLPSVNMIPAAQQAKAPGTPPAAAPAPPAAPPAPATPPAGTEKK
jgi:hypothetical protein